MFQSAMRALGTLGDRTLMIGDRLDTDIAGAHAAGLKTALLLTGVTSAEEATQSRAGPDAIFAGLPELLAAWEAA